MLCGGGRSEADCVRTPGLSVKQRGAQMNFKNIWPPRGPDRDVWAHLQMGLSEARDELRDLPKDLKAFTNTLADTLLVNRSRVVLERGEKRWADLDSELLSFEWVQYTTELKIAEEGIGRTTIAFDRYAEIRPLVAMTGPPSRAWPYLREAIHSHLFGFDSACIALCRAALEQLLRHSLVESGVYTVPQLRRERPTAGTLLAKSAQHKLVVTTYTAAMQVIRRGDQVMHSHMMDERIQRQSALDSVQDLGVVAVELFGGTPQFE